MIERISANVSAYIASQTPLELAALTVGFVFVGVLIGIFIVLEFLIDMFK